ncbi:hypothetical protein D3C73_1637690 [compost metagenome]
MVCLTQSHLDQPTHIGGAPVGANQRQAAQGLEACWFAIAFKALGTCIQTDSQNTCTSHDYFGFTRPHEAYSDV